MTTHRAESDPPARAGDPTTPPPVTIDPAEPLGEALTSIGDALCDAAHAVHMALHNGVPVTDGERDYLANRAHAWTSARQRQVDAARPPEDRPAPPPVPAGWSFPGTARKAHYFAEDSTMSACGRWAYFGKDRHPDDGAASPDDCLACRRIAHAEATT